MSLGFQQCNMIAVPGAAFFLLELFLRNPDPNSEKIQTAHSPFSPNFRGKKQEYLLFDSATLHHPA